MTPETLALLAEVIAIVGDGVKLLAHPVNGRPDDVDWSVEYRRVYRVPHLPVVLDADAVYSRSLPDALRAVLDRERTRDAALLAYLKAREEAPRE